ncbi:MAG: 1-acyl-sn-glycerol-3-phosphate acyltransferase, partial [Acidobacteriaceae bacterium]|nr:1-acyl-sn-glycerol-3-phosphate acyltransferase [Acidobacteriaceae bacterium]
EQQYGVVLDDTALQQVRTTDEVRNLIAHAPAQPPQTKGNEHWYLDWPWNPLMHGARVVFLETIAMPVVRFLAKPKTESKVANWPSIPILIVANHVTTYDAPLVLYALPRRVRRRVAVAMSGEILFELRQGRNQGQWFLNLVAPVGYLLITALFNVFPLPQRSGFRRSFRHAGEAVDRGYSVLVFPEGIRSPDGTPQGFKGGAGLLWKELGTPAVAVYLAGLGELKVSGNRWFRSGKIAVTVREILAAQPDKSPEELTKILERAVFGS